MSNISDTATKRHFYTLDMESDKYCIEKFYAQEIEPVLKNITDKIISLSICTLINTGSTILSDEDKLNLTKCIVFQLLRSTNVRSYAYQKFHELLPYVYQKAYDKFEKGSINWSEIDSTFSNNNDIIKTLSIQATLNEKLLDRMMTEIYYKTFILMKINGEREFITSDNPVILVNNLTNDAIPFKNGLTQNSTIIYYPLTTKILLGIFSYDSIFKYLQKNDCSFIGLKNESTFITTINKKQKEYCNEYIYSRHFAELDKL